MKPELYVKIYIKNEKHSFSILESIVRKIAMKGNIDQLFQIESFFFGTPSSDLLVLAIAISNEHSNMSPCAI